jgi:stage III sporulation protein AA
LYAHAETIKNGYIRCENGIRAGICGKAITEGGVIIGISEITSINIRIPHRIPMADKVILDILREDSFSVGILIYSAPGVGKTTVLRELCYSLTKEAIPLRFAVIDTREEICPDSFFSGPFDVFSGYPQGFGIEVATRTMAPQLILCDEIGNEQDAGAILKSQNSGVPLIATVHCTSFEELRCKKFLSTLLDAKVFRYCVGIMRTSGCDSYCYDVHKLW